MTSVTLELIVAIAVNVLFGIGVAALWCRYSGSKATKGPARRVGHRRETTEIDPANVPQYQATWRDMQ
jgi:hypothetical protein